MARDVQLEGGGEKSNEMPAGRGSYGNCLRSGGEGVTLSVQRGGEVVTESWPASFRCCPPAIPLYAPPATRGRGCFKASKGGVAWPDQKKGGFVRV